MTNFKIFLSFETGQTEFSKELITMFSAALSEFLSNLLKSRIEINSGLDFDNKPVTEEILASYSLILILTKSPDFSADNCQEYELIKKLQHSKQTNIRALFFTKPNSNTLKSSIITTNYDFFSFNNAIKTSKIEDLFNSQEFWLKMFDLSYDIITNQTIDEKETKTGIFLTEASPDLVYEKAALKRELIHMGYKVIDTSQLYNTQQELETITNSGLNQATLIIQLIGGSSGVKIETNDVIMLQHDLTAKHCHDHPEKTRLIWIPKNLVYTNREQRIEVEKIKADNHGLSGAEIVQTPFEMLKSIVHNRLQKTNSKPKTTLDAVESSTYVIYEMDQSKGAESLIRELKSKNHKIIEPIKSNNKRTLLKHHRESLLDCTSIIIYFSNSNTDWLISKHKDIIKAAGLGRLSPIKNKIIILDNTTRPNNNILNGYKVIEMHDKNAIESICTSIEND